MGLIQIKDTTFISMILIPQLCCGCFAGFYTFAIFLCRVNMFLRLLFEWRYSYGFKNIWLTSIYCTEVLSSYLLLLVVPMIRIYPTLENTYHHTCAGDPYHHHVWLNYIISESHRLEIHSIMECSSIGMYAKSKDK